MKNYSKGKTLSSSVYRLFFYLTVGRTIKQTRTRLSTIQFMANFFIWWAHSSPFITITHTNLTNKGLIVANNLWPQHSWSVRPTKTPFSWVVCKVARNYGHQRPRILLSSALVYQKKSCSFSWNMRRVSGNDDTNEMG